jgi:predicted nucleic acid-binding Zn ribbon protein
MSFFENVGKKVGKATQTAVKKSGEFIEVQKINLNIKTEFDRIENLYTQIGKLIYNEYCGGKELNDPVKDLCKQTKDIEVNISELKDKLSEMRKTKYCVICGKEIEKSEAFCSSCGSKQDISLMPKEDDFNYDNAKKQCEKCMTINDNSEEFCTNCGEKLNK